MKTGRFYSAGKLLLTGEYLVLFGAKALAVPLKLGQHMIVTDGPEPSVLRWTSSVTGKEWFTARFHLPLFSLIETSDITTAEFLQKLLSACASLAPQDFSAAHSYKIDTDLEFDRHWGLGSSSSLISNLAWWLEIDPYLLFKKVLPGSGYDVFCARANRPLLFQLKHLMPVVLETTFKPPFSEHLYFVYLGRKQDSQASVSTFKALSRQLDSEITEISDLTDRMLSAMDIVEFMNIMMRHEAIISQVLNLNTIGNERFNDFPGAVKSLGAWGGDFIMAATPEPGTFVRQYFRERGHDVIFRYDELVAGF